MISSKIPGALILDYVDHSEQFAIISKCRQSEIYGVDNMCGPLDPEIVDEIEKLKKEKLDLEERLKDCHENFSRS